MRRVSVIIVLALIVLPLTASAQFNVNIPFALEQELNVEINPTYPRPNEMVWITLTMYTADLDSSDIAWYQDGKQILVGRGLKQYSFRMGDVGESTDIEIRVRLQSGTSFTKKFTLTPSSVALVWEADSYVPPFYQGKALHPRQGRLKVVAMPEFVKDGKPIAASKLIYEWGNGLEAYQSQSGYGRNVLVVNGALLASTEAIELLVRDPVNNLVAQTFLDVPTASPEIIFYQNDPYYGFIFDQALGNSFELLTQEVQVLAAPFFITKEVGPILQYSWRLNGQAAPELQDSRTAVFRKPEGQSGQSVAKIEVKNQNRILQFADKSLTLMFEE